MENQLNKQSILNEIKNHKDSEWEKLEKILLTVVGGTLAASATFFVNKEIHFSHRYVLALSWIFLSASLVSLLFSYAFEEFFASDLFEKIKKYPKENFTIEVFESLKNRSALIGVNLTNYAALLFGIAGIITLTLFAYLNIL